MTVRDFQIHIDDEVLNDLRARLANARWPSAMDAESWADGTSLGAVRRLIDHWRLRFDWRAQESRLNQLRHHVLQLGSTVVHFVHQKGSGPAPMPLIMTHGWPGSFVEMERILPLLADPGAHGGDPADAFHVVVPSLPGFGFSAPANTGVSSRGVAAMWRQLMAALGYDRFAAQGGDIGSGVSLWLARLFPETVIGAHVNYVSASFRPATEAPGCPPPSREEQAYIERSQRFAAEEGAYAALHATKPQTLAFALTDSPIGLAAWIAEKFHGWSDHADGEDSALSPDVMLTDISLYWFSNSIDAALRLYKENRLDPLAFAPGERVEVPVGVAVFPRELPMPPRSWVERVFPVTQWAEMPAGGHFAALEQPALLAEQIRSFFRPMRG